MCLPPPQASPASVSTSFTISPFDLTQALIVPFALGIAAYETPAASASRTPAAAIPILSLDIACLPFRDWVDADQLDSEVAHLLEQPVQLGLVGEGAGERGLARVGLELEV